MSKNIQCSRQEVLIQRKSYRRSIKDSEAIGSLSVNTLTVAETCDRMLARVAAHADKLLDQGGRQMHITEARAHFPAAEEYVYLNNASRSVLPRETIEAMTRYLSFCPRQEMEKSPEFAGLLSEVRSQIGELLNAHTSEIALSWNTSVPLNIVAQGLPLVPGDRVIVGRSEFPANLYVWENLRRKGAEVTVLPPGQGFTTAADVREALDARTKIVAVSFVAFHNGYRAELEEMGELCKKVGALLVVDAIQGVGAIELDVKKCGAGVVACGGQKWLLAPFGTGFLYCSKELIGSVWPLFAGWLSVKDIDRAFNHVTGIPFVLAEDARRFEIGTLAYHDIAGFRESLRIILSVGVREIERHIFTLLDGLIEELKRL
ncbi:MAG: aminotransferase class V-fold PLP-dependent enzyme, partial [Candidatus Eisenbacteria bacterium]